MYEITREARWIHPEQLGCNILYCDGGVVAKNPSPFAGTWCWATVAPLAGVPDGEMQQSESGYVRPLSDGLLVTNNQTEFVAVMMGLEALPSGWSGAVASDSGVTIGRFRDGNKTKGIPEEWAARAAMVVGRLGTLRWVLLGGHPTRKELDLGIRKDGKLVSRHNVFCDKRCGQLAEEDKQRRGIET